LRKCRENIQIGGYSSDLGFKIVYGRVTCGGSFSGESHSAF